MQKIIKVILMLILIQSVYAQKIDLTKEELIFLSNHKEIVLGSDKGWKPYVIENEEGIKGYDKDVLTMINNLTGANFTLKLGSWKELQKDAEHKRIDGLSTGTASEKRKHYLNFSKPYISMHKMVITKKDDKRIKKLSDLDNKVIVIHESNLVDEKLASRFKKSKILKVDSVEKLLHSVATGEADVMFGNGATLYLANQLGLSNLNLTIPLYEKMDLVFGVRKDWPEAISIINKALNHIGEQKLLELKREWFLFDVKKGELGLTKIEKEYLRKKEVIRLCADPSFPPYESINKNGKFEGIGADIIKIISKNINKKIELVDTKNWTESINSIKNKKCDLLSIAVKTKKRQEYLNFTKPYIHDAVVVATKNEQLFVNDSSDLSNRKIGISEGYALGELLKKENPDVQIVTVKNVNDGLKQVQDSKLFAYVDALSAIAYAIQKGGILDLKIAGKLEFDAKFNIATRKDEPALNSIIQKALNNIEEEQIRTIVGKWIAIKVERSFDYKRFIYIVVIFVIILILIIHRNRTIKRMNNQLEISNKKVIKEQQMINRYVPIISTDLNGVITHINNAYTNVTGYKEEDLLNKTHKVMHHPDMKKEFFNNLWKTIRQDNVWQGEIKNYTKDGDSKYFNTYIEPLFDENNIKVGYRSILEDITDKKRIEEISITDSLTGLYNRRYFDELFPKIINSAKREEKQLAFIIMDIDHFKEYNDTYGHKMGDITLSKVANTIKESLHRADDYSFRLGGEEFGVVFKTDTEEKALMFAESIRSDIESLKITHINSSSSNYVTISMGLVCKNSAKIDNIDKIYEEADILLYKAKREGRNRVITK